MSGQKKKFWWPPWAYESRPWAALTLGGLLGPGALITSIVMGSWGPRTTLVFAVGCVLCIYGAITAQLRREYRQSSKWSREHPPSSEDRDK